MNSALENVARILGAQSVGWWGRCLARLEGLSRVQTLFSLLATARDAEQLQDYLCEVLYGVVFGALRFSLAYAPLGDRGPDWQVTRQGCRALVEVKRFRRIHDGPPLLDLSRDGSTEEFTLSVYGNPPRDIRKAADTIVDKLRQVADGTGIIAIWNDDEDLEESEVDSAVAEVERAADAGALSIPSGLQFILYGSKWMSSQQFYCFPVRRLHEPFGQWKDDLEKVTLSGLAFDLEP